jgi:hypothetical protein
MYQHLTKLLQTGVIAALCAVIGTPVAFAKDTLVGTFQLTSTSGAATVGVITTDEWDTACEAVGGPGSRAATTRDLLTLPWAEFTDTTSGWVRPFIIGMAGAAYIGKAGEDPLLDSTGIVGSLRYLQCQKSGKPWNSNSREDSAGLVSFGNAAYLELCDVSLQMICVIPVR